MRAPAIYLTKSGWLLGLIIGITLVVVPHAVAAQGQPDRDPPKPGGIAPGKAAMIGEPPAQSQTATQQFSTGAVPDLQQRNILDTAASPLPTGRAEQPSEDELRIDVGPHVALTPARIITQGCNAAPQNHLFAVENATGSTGAFTLSYEAPPGIGVQGPANIALTDGQTATITVRLTPNLCPAPASPVIATIAITGSGYGAVSTIEKWIIEGPIWKQIPSEPDNGRMDNVVAAYNGQIWSITGAGANANVRTFDVTTDSWKTVPNSAPPFGANHARSGCQHGTKVFVYGDLATANFTGLWSYNMTTNAWQQEAPGGTAPPQGGIWAPAWANDSETNRCYLTGGATQSGGGDLTTVYVYDPVTNAWLTPLPAFTSARDFHAAFVFRQPADNKKLLCVAGGAQKALPDDQPLTSTQCYDLGAAPGSWKPENTDMAPLTNRWWGMGYAVRAGTDSPQLWLVGGTRGVTTDRTEYYDTVTNAWVFGSSLTTAGVYRTAAVTLGNKIYQVGGSTGNFDYTGNANELSECPYCQGIRLEPKSIGFGGCNNVAQQHRFSLWNHTAAAGSYALRFAATRGVTVNGPASVAAPAGGRAVFTMGLTPAICPDADVGITATIHANGGGYQAHVELEQWITGFTAWEAIASEPGDGRHDHVLAAYADKIWAIGGTDDTGIALPVRTYDPATNAWAEVANSAAPWGNSTPRSGCQVGSRVYLYGDGSTYHGLVYYDLAANQWQQVTNATNPPALADLWAPAWAYDAELGLCYLTGGGDSSITGRGNQATVYAYNPAANAWSQLPDFTTPRNWHAAFVTQHPVDTHKLLCIAGGDNEGTGDLQSTQCYDFTLGAWKSENTDLDQLPETWWGMGYTQRTIGAVTQLWIIGGKEGADETHHTLFFDFLHGGWRYAGLLGTAPIYRNAAVTLGDTIYHSGGYYYDWGEGEYAVNGQADRTTDCPACIGLFLQPDAMQAVGCAAPTQTHTFELWNLTGATGNFAMSYMGGPQVAVTGPAQVTSNQGTVTPVAVTVTPRSCPAPGTLLTAAIGAAGNSFTDTSTLVKTIAEQVWVYRTPATSTQWAAGGAVLNNKLYVAGGVTAEPALAGKGCHVYNPATDSWSSCPDLPAARQNTVGASDGQAVYMLGGKNPDEEVLATVVALQGGAWQLRAPLPAARAWGAAAGAPGVLYYSGGYADDIYQTDTFWQYTAATDTWSALPALPGATASHAMVVAGGKVYVLPAYATEVWIYNIGARSWRVVEPRHPAPPAEESLALVYGNRILRAGGFVYWEELTLADVWAFDMAAEDFAPVQPLQSARSLAVGGMLNGRPYVGLGVNFGDELAPLKSLETLSICAICRPGAFLPLVTR